MKSKIKTLLKLLEDEDIEVSARAMSEILKKDRFAWRIISRLHENPDPAIRRKAHQMQFAAKSRARRKNLSSRLAEKNFDIIRALIELHLQWFDEDNETLIAEKWENFKKIASNWHPNNLENISEMMSKMDFMCMDFYDLEPADYCIGEIISSKNGADFMLCLIARILSRKAEYNPVIIATDAGFCLYDENRKTGLFPAKKWAVAKCPIESGVRRWSDHMLVHLAAYSMYFCAVAEGNLRYSYILGSCIAGSMGLENPFEIMPYPLGDLKNDDTN